MKNQTTLKTLSLSLSTLTHRALYKALRVAGFLPMESIGRTSCEYTEEGDIIVSFKDIDVLVETETEHAQQEQTINCIQEVPMSKTKGYTIECTERGDIILTFNDVDVLVETETEQAQQEQTINRIQEVSMRKTTTATTVEQTNNCIQEIPMRKTTLGYTKEQADLLWRNKELAVQAQDLSAVFHAFAEAEEEIFSLDEQGNVTVDVKSSSRTTNSPAYLAVVAKAEYEGLEDLSPELIQLIGEQVLDSREGRGYNRIANDQEVRVTFQRFFINKEGEGIWYNLTSEEIFEFNGKELVGFDQPVRTLADKRNPVEVELSVEEVLQYRDGAYSVNDLFVFEALKNMTYKGKFFITEAEDIRIVLSHVDLHLVVGFKAGEGYEVEEVAPGIVAVLPDNRYVQDKSSFAAIDLQASNEEIMFGRSQEVLGSSAADVAAAMESRIYELNENRECDRISERTKRAVEVTNDRLTEARVKFPRAVESISAMNKMYSEKRIKDLRNFVANLKIEQVEAILTVARTLKNDKTTLILDYVNLADGRRFADNYCPYKLIVNRIALHNKALKLAESKNQEPVVGVSATFTEKAVEIIAMLNQDGADAQTILNNNRNLAEEIRLAAVAGEAKGGARIKDVKVYRVVCQLAKLVA